MVAVDVGVVPEEDAVRVPRIGLKQWYRNEEARRVAWAKRRAPRVQRNERDAVKRR